MKAQRVNGAGIGLRPVHIPYILEQRPDVPWFEILIDNYLYGDVDSARRVLADIRTDYPLSFHSVGLDVGSVQPVDPMLLRSLRERQRELEPDSISTHLCWTAGGGVSHHDLLPLPFTDEAVRHCAQRIAEFQDMLGERILIENISTYLRFAPPDRSDNETFMREGEFIRAVAEAADCWILLDINNLYINLCNHSQHGDFALELDRFLADVPGDRVRQYHLAGHEDRETHLLDTHGAPVSESVWELFERALSEWGPAPVCIERDANLPPELAPLQQEARRAAECLEQAAAACN